MNFGLLVSRVREDTNETPSLEDESEPSRKPAAQLPLLPLNLWSLLQWAPRSRSPKRGTLWASLAGCVITTI